MYLQVAPVVGESAKITNVMFCRVCGFRAGVWESYRISRSFGYGYGTVTENSQKLRVLWHGRTEPTEVPGGYKKNDVVLVPRVLGHGAYRTHRRSSGYGYERLTELTEVPGTGSMN